MGAELWLVVPAAVPDVFGAELVDVPDVVVLVGGAEYAGGAWLL